MQVYLFLGFVITLYLCVKSCYGSHCYDCTGTDCDELITRGLSGQCELENNGRCFTRTDPNQIIYKGCADAKNWPSLDLSYVGCRHQTYGAWRQSGQVVGGATLWCFCKGHLCNGKQHNPSSGIKAFVPSNQVISMSNSHKDTEKTNNKDMKQSNPHTDKLTHNLYAKLANGHQGVLAAAREATPAVNRDHYRYDPCLGSGCQHYCAKQQFRATCRCFHGFTLAADQFHCIDIDECLSSPCQYRCENLPGAFRCICPTSEKLTEDRLHCQAKDQCRIDNGGCSDYCSFHQGHVHCHCPKGHELDQDKKKCKDIDECLLHSDRCQHDCVNTDGDYHCKCRHGYIADPKDAHKCIDINECDIKQHSCQHFCLNLIGSYKCVCKQGYQISTDQHTCKDIDECQHNNGGCHKQCTNVPGSFHCSCPKDSKLSLDGKTCESKHPCSGDKHGCSHLCVTKGTGYTCTCKPGYSLKEDKHTCQDINECKKNNGDCQQICINQLGSFVCKCRTGYKIENDWKTCTDIDECDVNNGGCEKRCLNTPGSFICSCPTGYHMKDGKCQDKNECNRNNGGCQQICLNQVGSYVCKCRPGYSLSDDWRSCIDINECSHGNGGCDKQCINTVGSFHCSCPHGYRLQNGACLDIDECWTTTTDCEQICINTPGSYHCQCFKGYDLDDDKKSCKATAVCRYNNGGCQQICLPLLQHHHHQHHNTQNSQVPSSHHYHSRNSTLHHCKCYPGYKLSDHDHRSCIDIDECHSEEHGCEQVCVNTAGSYHCICSSGQLNSDGKTCIDVDLCSVNNGGCEQICQYDSHSLHLHNKVTCSCRPGFILHDDGKSCSDINECSLDNGRCAHVCNNTLGSFTCSCRSELFHLSSDGLTCFSVCPVGYEEFGDTGSCYKTYSSDSEARSYHDASLKCRQDYHTAHLISINSAFEQSVIHTMLSGNTKLLDGWQGWWTSGIFSVDDFYWRRTGGLDVRVSRDNPAWGFRRRPFPGTCVWLLQLPVYAHRWGNYDCDTHSGFICEVDLE